MADLANFLKSAPFFPFQVNLEDSLRSFSAARALNSDLLAYRSNQFRVDVHRETEQRILNDISSHLSSRISALDLRCLDLRDDVSTITDLPIIDKDYVRRNIEKFVDPAYVSGEFPCWIKLTSGSTGPPLACYYEEKFYLACRGLPIQKCLSAADIDFDQSSDVFSLTVNCHSPAYNFVVPDSTGSVGHSAFIMVDERRIDSVDRALDLLDIITPVCLSAAPYVLRLLLNRAQVIKHRPNKSIRAIVSSGAFLSGDLRRSLAAYFECTVVNAYGLSEFGLVAVDCPVGDGLHIDEGAVLAEVIDERERGCVEGASGDLVLSSTSNVAMPLIRYKTGDKARIDHGVCGCGRKSARLVGEFGHRIPCWQFDNGALYIPTELHNLYRKFSVRRFSAQQRSVKEIEILLEPQLAGSDSSQLSRDVSEYVSGCLPATARVSVRITNLEGSNMQQYGSDLAHVL